MTLEDNIGIGLLDDFVDTLDFECENNGGGDSPTNSFIAPPESQWVVTVLAIISLLPPSSLVLAWLRDFDRWYHGRLDRHSTEERLRAAGKPGSYLVRESDRKPGSYVLSYFGKTGINHFRWVDEYYI